MIFMFNRAVYDLNAEGERDARVWMTRTGLKDLRHPVLVPRRRLKSLTSRLGVFSYRVATSRRN